MSRCTSFALVVFATLVASACKQGGRPADEDSQATTPGQGGDRGEEPRALRLLETDELTPAIIGKAQQILEHYRDQPLGYEVPFELAGRRYVGRLEQHYHPPGTDEGPTGQHLGVTVYVFE